MFWENGIQFSSVAQSCPTLCDPMNCSTPGFPVHHQLPEFTQPHVHQISDAIQPSHPLSSSSPPAPNPSQHQSFPVSQLFASGAQTIGALHLGLTSLISLHSKGLLSLLQHHNSKLSILQCSAFFMVQLSHLYMT